MLFLFDCDRQVEIAVPNQPGSVVTIGRDSILQCNDARISRNHGTLTLDGVEGGSVQITSTHTNPIFIRTGADGVLNILAKDLTATLQKGDKFALLPDQYWYEVRFGEAPTNDEVTSTGPTLRVRTMEEVNSGPIPEAPAVVVSDAGEKRKNDDDSEADPSKKFRSEDNTEDQAVTSNQGPPEEPEAAASAPALESPSFEVTTPTVVKPDPDGERNEAAEGSSSTTSASAPKSPQPDANPPAAEVKKETADSTGPPLRPSCQFGIACYRHTADHRAEFAHPHDVDYRRPALPPAPDDAPHCPFGAACYRRNPQHFREYQHPDSSEYEATVVRPPVNVVRLPNMYFPPPPLPPRPRLNQFVRDVLMATIADGSIGPDDDTESGDEDDEDDGRSLFGSEGDSDEFIPGGDFEVHSDSELESNDERDEE